MTQPASAREAAERNAAAIMSGNLSQLMADITPEVLAQVMAMAGQAGSLSLTQMPDIEGYEFKQFGPQDDGSELFHVTFRSGLGNVTVAESWKLVMGQWKIVAVSLVAAEPTNPA